jgi:uncharacterized protein (TIGR02145 family)
MRKIGLARKLVYVVPFLLLWACEEKENADPTVKITTPKNGAVLIQGAVVPIKAMAEDEDGSIANITLYIDGEEVGSSDQTTFIYNWNTADYEPAEYAIGASATDDLGASDVYNIDVLLGASGGLNPDLDYDTLTDIDGNVYAAIEIGTQVWMAENLKVTHYPDGTPIPEITDAGEWNTLAPEAQALCWFNNQIEYRDTSGALYTWAAAMYGEPGSDTLGPQGVCPDGWHLPTDAEWKTLEIYLGMSETEADSYDWRGSDEGGQLKEVGFSNWTLPNEGATNATGFTAVPGGFRSARGLFYSVSEYATFWTATAHGESTEKAWYRTLNYEEEQVYRHYNSMQIGMSVRCVKNQ